MYGVHRLGDGGAGCNGDVRKVQRLEKQECEHLGAGREDRGTRAFLDEHESEIFSR